MFTVHSITADSINQLTITRKYKQFTLNPHIQSESEIEWLEEMSVKCITKNWASCKCFYIKNIYLKQLDEHLQFRDGQDQEFRDYCQEYHPSADSEELLLIIKTEIERRKTRFSLIEENRRRILENYQPLHKELYSQPLKLQLNREPKRLTENVYNLAVLDSETCDKITSELSHFYSQGACV